MLRLSTFTADERLRSGVRTGTQIHLDRLSVAPFAVNLPSAARAKAAESTPNDIGSLGFTGIPPNADTAIAVQRDGEDADDRLLSAADEA